MAFWCSTLYPSRTAPPAENLKRVKEYQSDSHLSSRQNPGCYTIFNICNIWMFAFCQNRRYSVCLSDLRARQKTNWQFVHSKKHPFRCRRQSGPSDFPEHLRKPVVKMPPFDKDVFCVTIKTESADVSSQINPVRRRDNELGCLI